MSDEAMKAEHEFELATKKLAGKGGQGVENNYAKAYAKLVALGLRAPLRKKYRG